MSLPKTSNTVESLTAKTETEAEAIDTVAYLIDRNKELEEIQTALRPLLISLSASLYGVCDHPITLDKLIADSIAAINGMTGQTLQ